MMENKKYLSIKQHYENCLDKHGDSHLGMDWPKLEDVDKRYGIMLELILLKNTASEKLSILDFGCGTSHFYEFLLKNKMNLNYSGLDISEKPIEISRKKFPQNTYYCLDILDKSEQLPNFDYIIMNGIFTEKIDLTFEEMFDYMKNVLTVIFQKANKGIAFNVMSKAVDWEREDLFHLPTDLLINFLTKNMTRNFIIRNDYGLYEYTVYIYK
jgi:SAM-dependent methyltransferase